MTYKNGSVSGIRIAYIGGGSRGWAWHLMSDLVSCDDISGDVLLYDIDREAARHNAIIGEKYNGAEGAKSHWNYQVCDTIEAALTGADFVIISILPATFEEMESDVHAPEKYGIYQSVGDTSGPGGILRAMRTVPIFEGFAEKIRECCPKAWVINYTNPMTQCVRALYRVFPEIRAFGCCHEVFGTQKLLKAVVENKLGYENVDRRDIKVNPVGVNHFTWLTAAHYQGRDLFPVYREFWLEHPQGFSKEGKSLDSNWANTTKSAELVKRDLFLRYGWIAAAGDRHLAEFCPGKWYLESPERVKEMGYGLTAVSWRKEDLQKRLEKSRRLVSGQEPTVIKRSGEEGVQQIRALLGLTELVTNVNLPNRGQIPNLPLGAVVETNAAFRDGTVTPVMAGPIPEEIASLIGRICTEQEEVAKGIAQRDTHRIFAAFAADPLVTCGLPEAKKLFVEMFENTKAWLSMYPALEEAE